jgi:hypothetical protein
MRRPWRLTDLFAFTVLQVDGEVVGDLGGETIRDRFAEARTIGFHGQGVEPVGPIRLFLPPLFVTVMVETLQRVPISTFDHCAHSGSRSSVIAAFRLSRLVRFRPWAEFAPTVYRIASRRVPARTSAPISVSPSDLAAMIRWKPSASQYSAPSKNTVACGKPASTTYDLHQPSPSILLDTASMLPTISIRT